MGFKLGFVALVVLSAGSLLLTTTASQSDNAALPLPLLPRVLNGTEQTCPPNDLRSMARSELAQDVRTLLQDNVRTLLQDNISCPAVEMATPATSCGEISANCPSGLLLGEELQWDCSTGLL